MNTLIKKIKYCREAANVVRCHTIPALQRPTDGQHTFNMLAMLRILRPDAPISLVWAILEHDLPERITGDIPAPMRWTSIVDKDRLQNYESRILEKVVGHDHLDGLTLTDLKWLNGLDMLEFYLWCRDEQMLGNRNLDRYFEKITQIFNNNTASYAPEIVDLFWNIQAENWEPAPDNLEEW